MTSIKFIFLKMGITAKIIFAKRHNEVRKIIKKLNNLYKIKTNFFQENFGKQIAPPKGIDWFFKHVKRGVILEDDTMPSKSFFEFSERLLKLHDKDKKIFQICGSGTFRESLEVLLIFVSTLDAWLGYMERSMEKI